MHNKNINQNRNLFISAKNNDFFISALRNDAIVYMSKLNTDEVQILSNMIHVDGSARDLYTQKKSNNN